MARQCQCNDFRLPGRGQILLHSNSSHFLCGPPARQYIVYNDNDFWVNPFTQAIFCIWPASNDFRVNNFSYHTIVFRTQPDIIGTRKRHPPLAPAALRQSWRAPLSPSSAVSRRRVKGKIDNMYMYMYHDNDDILHKLMRWGTYDLLLRFRANNPLPASLLLCCGERGYVLCVSWCMPPFLHPAILLAGVGGGCIAPIRVHVWARRG